MRTKKDRIRHSILYELFLLVITIPLGAALLNENAAKIGALSLAASLIAMSWNYIYNYGFDRALLALKRPLYPRGFFLRTAHALLFEGGLLFVTIPALMYFLKLTFWQALAVDVGFLILVPIYTLLYNWCYDLAFPVPTAAVQA